MSHREELLNQLKMIRLEWFRSAANLDRIIDEIEYELSEVDGDDDTSNEMFHLYIRMMAAHRTDAAKMHGWDEIQKLESVVWQQLIDSKKES